MGAGFGKQQIGDRVKTAKRKLEESEKMVEEQFERLSKSSPETLSNMVESIVKTLNSYSPFSEATLLLAFKADPERVTKTLTECTRKVLTAPIQKEQYQWFKQYVFPLSVWFKKMENGEYLYSEMMKITNSKQEKIIANMNAVYEHLQSHSKWSEIMNIQNNDAINRQDHATVGLLQEAGIRDILEVKVSGDDRDEIDGLKHFIDTNLAVNTLMTTAKEIDKEFQREMGTILSRHGDFKPGPMKKVERALSKIENDYMDEKYPKAAKLLDIVRCSVGYNTIDQLLEGYNAFIEHIVNNGRIWKSRVKNGFLDEDDGGYRDIKVNVLYQSVLNPEINMICEVQFILNQYLYEKKKIHKLYSIAREQPYFEMVVHEEEEEVDDGVWWKGLKFEPFLKVRDDVTDWPSNAHHFGQCTIESDLGLLAMNGYKSGTFQCANLETKKKVFYTEQFGTFGHHWITINDQKYLSLQTDRNTISYFRVSDDHQFEEDESMKITLDDNDYIDYCEYDESFENIYMIRDQSILEKRAMNDLNSVAMSIELETELRYSESKSLSLSKDGKFCIIGGGSNYFFIIDLETKEQFKMTTQKMLNMARAPCFINGESDLVAVGGFVNPGDEEILVEIWSVSEKKMVHYIEERGGGFVGSMYSANDILAVGFVGDDANYLQLYDVSSWSIIYRYDIELRPYSLFLTQDNKYLVTGGWDGEKCVVLKIE